MGIFWKDRITNAEVRQRSGHGTLEVTLKVRRLLWLGHLYQIEDNRLSKQAGICLVSSNDKEQKRASTEAIEGHGDQ